MARYILGTTVWSAAIGTAAALLLSVPAVADPTLPGPPPGPVPGPVEAPVQPAAADVPGVAPAAAAAPTAVPHLSSPENLPPGTTELPEQPDGPRMSYLRELWHAYQTQEVSGGDALLLLSQRPLTAPDQGTQPAAAPAPDAAVPAPDAPAAPAPAAEPAPAPAPGD